MLAKTARISNSADFIKATKSGLRSTSNSLIGYLHLSNSENPAKCGLIINKSVGNSVMRNRVARKVRHSISSNLERLPNGSLFVVRALPNSISSDIQNEIIELVTKLINKINERTTVNK